jgi:hypothetical protein
VLRDRAPRSATGADFVPFTLSAIVPVAPGTEVALLAVAPHETTEFLSCGVVRTGPVAFAVTDYSTFATSVPADCASAVAIQVVVRSKIVAEFNATTANSADIGALAMDKAAARRVYGWSPAPSSYTTRWRNALNARPLIAGMILVAVALMVGKALPLRRRFVRVRL